MKKTILALAALLAITNISSAQFLAQHSSPWGVNLSGPEYPPSRGGPYFPTAADFTYLSSLTNASGQQAIRIVRMPIAWEGLQPTLNAPLDPTFLGNITTTLSRAASVGIKVIVELHNFGHYCGTTAWASTCQVAGNAGVSAAGVNAFYDGVLTTAAFADVWSRIATALNGNPGLAGYGLQNEPTGFVGVNLLGSPNGFSNTVGARNWFINNGSLLIPQAVGSNPVSASYGPKWLLGSGSNGFGSISQAFTFANVPYTLSAYMQARSGTEAMGLQIVASNLFQTITTTPIRYALTATPAAGSANASIFWNSSVGHEAFISNAQLELLGSQHTVTITNASPAVITWTGHGFSAGQQVFFTNSGGALNTGLNTNQCYFVLAAGLTTNTFEVSATAGGAAINTSSGGSGTQTGNAVADYEPNPYLSYAQAASTAIRLVDTTTPIYVNGFEAGTASLWPLVNWDLLALTGTPFVFEAHQYFDSTQMNGPGQYSSNYTAYTGVNNFTGTQAALPFLRWLSATSSSGFFGEFGVPNNATDGNANWLILQSNFLKAIWQYRVPVTQWYYNSNAAFAGDTLNFAPVSGIDDTRLTQMLAIP